MFKLVFKYLLKYIPIVLASKKIVVKMEDSPLSNRDRREYAVEELLKLFPQLKEKDAYLFIHGAL